MNTIILTQQEIKDFLMKHEDVTSFLTNDDGPVSSSNDEFFVSFQEDIFNTETTESLVILENESFNNNYDVNFDYDSDSDESSQKLVKEYKTKLTA